LLSGRPLARSAQVWSSSSRAQLFHELAVDDAQLEAELVAHLIAPLDLQAGRADHEHSARAMAQEQLLHRQAGLDGLAQADVVGDEQADARHLQGAHHGVELVVLDGDAAAEWRVEVADVGRGHGAPAHGVEEGVEAVRGIEAGRGIGQGRAVVHEGAGLELPDDLELLAQPSSSTDCRLIRCCGACAVRSAKRSRCTAPAAMPVTT
jgi:hypothetical protein